MRGYLVAGLAAVLACGVPGIAQADRYAPRQAAAPAVTMATTSPNWTGGQFGGSGGGSNLSQNFAEPGSFLCPGVPCIETPFSFSDHTTKFTAGGFLGYRVRLGNIVVGVEGDLSGKSGETSYTQSGITNLGVAETFTGSIKQGWDASLRARLGTLVTPSLLLYATAGAALSEISGSYSYAAYNGCCESVTGSKSWSSVKAGYTVGTGVEMQVFQGIKARVEYRFTDFGDQTTYVPLTTICAGGSSCGTLARIDTETSFHTVRLGLGFDF